jgi:hypothetical protein
MASGVVGGRLWLCIFFDGGSGNHHETADTQARYLKSPANHPLSPQQYFIEESGSFSFRAKN